MIVNRKTGNSLYPANQVFNLQEEFDRILVGDELNPGIAQDVLIRRLKDQTCVCWNGKTGSNNPYCRYCNGEGYLWVESPAQCYFVRNFGGVLNPSNVISQSSTVGSYGIQDVNRALAYFRPQTFPNYERYLTPTHPAFDAIYELKVDGQGRTLRPFLKTAKWRLLSFALHRGDNGAPIYVEAGVQKEWI